MATPSLAAAFRAAVPANAIRCTWKHVTALRPSAAAALAATRASRFKYSTLPTTLANGLVLRNHTSRVSPSKLFTMPLVGLLSLIGASEVLITMARPRDGVPLRRPGQVTIHQSIQECLRENEIIGDVVDDFLPSSLLLVKYPTGAEAVVGNEVKPSETQDEPKLKLTGAGDADARYTIVLTDPDAPSREDPKWSEFCHWIITDVKVPTPEQIEAAGDDPSATFARTEESKRLVSYMGPAPPPNTGKHRYVFLVYKQTGGSPREGPKERKLWGGKTPRTGVKEWAARNGLELVGANFFVAENEGK